VAEFIAIKVKNLKPLTGALKKVDAEAPKQLRIALNGVADIVVRAVVPQIPRKSGAAAKSVKVKSTRTSARIAAGGTKASYYPFLDFGGSVGIRKSVHRPFIKQGRYIYPTLERKQGEITKALEQALSDVISNAGLRES
jgi:hypothetical protein